MAEAVPGCLCVANSKFTSLLWPRSRSLHASAKEARYSEAPSFYRIGERTAHPAAMTDVSRAAKPGQAPPAPLVRAELDRILASELFVRSERLSSFLRFIVERTLAGDGNSLKEHTIAIDVYGKDTSFDPAEDPIVRVDARRLRDKLREYYASAGDAAIVITVPKGQYTPVFHTAVATTLPSASASRQPGKRAMPLWPLAAAGVIVIAAVMWLVWSRIEHDPPPQAIIVTSLPGAEDDPSLSPDGRSVVFSWGASTDANDDIWIKAVEGEQKRNLTNTPGANEHWPRWSPDGQAITFSRRTKEGSAVIKVSMLGGHEDIIATNASHSSWTSDSHGLVYWSTADAHGHLMYHDLDTGQRWPLTQAPDGFDDISPRVSPDGQMLAFVRTSAGRSAIFLMPMTGGTPTPLGEWVSGRPIGGLDWLPDSRALVAGVPTEGNRQLMRIPVNGRGPGVPVPGIPSLDSAGMSVSRVDATGRLRLAVSAGEPNVRLRLVDLGDPSPDGAITADSPFCDATRMDSPGQFSPDAQQVAFVSNRDGTFQIWVANRDGSNLRAVTHIKDGATTHVSPNPTSSASGPPRERQRSSSPIGSNKDPPRCAPRSGWPRSVLRGVWASPPCALWSAPSAA